MAKKKKAVVVRKTVVYGSCEVYSTFPMRCPLCGTVVPPKTPHLCKVLGPQR